MKSEWKKNEAMYEGMSRVIKYGSDFLIIGGLALALYLEAELPAGVAISVTWLLTLLGFAAFAVMNVDIEKYRSAEPTVRSLGHLQHPLDMTRRSFFMAPPWDIAYDFVTDAFLIVLLMINGNYVLAPLVILVLMLREWARLKGREVIETEESDE